MIVAPAKAGGIIEALREWHKDLRYRNRHERSAGELDLLERRLRLAREYGVLDATGQVATALLALASGAAPAKALGVEAPAEGAVQLESEHSRAT